MKRLLEMLFPILHYTRLRREVGAASALLAAALTTVSALILTMWQPYRAYLESRWFTARLGPAVTTGTWGELVTRWAWLSQRFLSRYAAGLVRAAVIVGAALLILAGIELLVALVFVRKRPGRRRPLCTWQTVKYVLLGGWSWIWLFGFWAVFVWNDAAAAAFARRSETLFLTTAILSFACLPVLLLGAIAAQAANAVVALQDDRRCTVCGYFLIGLTTARCPECGTPFDPVKLGMPAAGAPMEGTD